ncbi:hypothetical protein [Streptomyces sp. Ag109_O5-10]|uniref:hypothetical protein n=1 Tax=Streptomyces sp. Ag109_O5-10 TaxID=1855349 RepID=UPI0008955D03|nr:hypothetical protein [Streptomyces sp. Ag109_O5-10]SEE41584.1 hypothetical protein SAMN05216533_2238 [Streptomyces sp. Ag109_O5-10]
MRERPGSGDETSTGEEAKGSSKRIDLSVPQVAGSAVAAVVAAKLASYFGVYGTILGAGVVSVVATCGGSVFQHFFRRTGEQFRDATATGPGVPRPRKQAPLAPGEFTAGTVYRARVRTWRRPLVAAALVFGVTMAGITACELVAGASFSGGHGTTVSGAVTGGTTSSGSAGTSGGSGSSDATHPPGSAGSSGAGTGSGDGTAASPAPSPSSSSAASPAPRDTETAAPVPSGSASTEPGTAPTPDDPAGGSPATDPGPSADSRSGTAGPDRAGPAAR